MQVLLKTHIRADSKKWRADSVVAQLKSFRETIMRADSKGSKPTRLECRLRDRSLEPTHLKKSRLRQSGEFEDYSLEPTQTKRSRLDQTMILLHCSSEPTRLEKSPLDQSVILKYCTLEPTRRHPSWLEGQSQASNGYFLALDFEPDLLQ